MGLDACEKRVRLADGSTIRYNRLLTTAPLDTTMCMVQRPELCVGLLKSSSHIVGLGFRGEQPPGETQWMYFPESDCPFYRATMFSKYSQYNVPDVASVLGTICLAGDTSAPVEPSQVKPGPYWSLMFEVSESPEKPVDVSECSIGGRTFPRVVLDTIRGAINTKLCESGDEIVSIYYRKFDYGYPTPSLGRDKAIRDSLAYLRLHNIWSRGRFGSWKYEVANQDHSCMLGVEAVDNMLYGSRELTLHYPDLVNAPGNKETDKRFVVPGFEDK